MTSAGSLFVTLPQMPVQWPDEIDEIITGDLTAGLAFVTPAGGAVITGVSPVGLRDREAGTVTFTTSLGFGKKLDRIRRDPRVSLAYHAREHGFSNRHEFVVVQGRAEVMSPDLAFIEDTLGPAAERFMGKPKQGAFWDRWLKEYYQTRVPVNVHVERIAAWPDLDCKGRPQIHGAPPPGAPSPQEEPAKGTGPRIPVDKAAQKLSALPHRLLAWVGGDGFPDIAPVDIQTATTQGITLAGNRRLPPGGRRAGLLGHRYNAQLVGLVSLTHTGWLTVEDNGRALYAPHTTAGFRAPANKTVMLLANGFMAKRGLRKARAATSS
jgi:hypothetical protein